MYSDSKPVSWPGWETVQLIGRGSFGSVYEIQRDVFGDVEKAALKVISIPQNASDIDEMYSDGYDDESITSTFQSHLKGIVAEYSLMRKMNGCPNIVSCDDIRYIQHDNGIGWDIFIKMELLTPLTKALPAQVSEDAVVKIAKDLCNALVICKEHNVVHRDIKPQNIFVSQYGDYKLGDFGIAKTVEKTMGGTKIGTYKYMAPEVYNNQPYGHAADIYSLGLVLYWLLNERRMPFMPMPPAKLSGGMEKESQLRRFSGEQLPPPAHGSEKLKKIVLKACAYDPKERFSSAAELLHALELSTELPDPGPGPVPPDPGPGPEPQPPDPEPQPGRKHHYLLYGAIAVLLLLIGFFTIHIWTDVTCTESSVCKICGKTGTAAPGHSWSAATCTDPKTCSICGATEDGPKGHIWQNATCMAPKTCSICKKTEGSALEHQWKDATCNTPKTCSICKKTEGSVLEHQWEEATLTLPETCSLCGTTRGQTRSASILAEAEQYAEDKQYRLAIETLDNAWTKYGERRFYDLAADYRMEFGMYANTILAAGKYNSILLDSDGNPRIVGDSQHGELQANNWSNMIAVSLGDRHVLGIGANGTVWAAGANDVNQCNVYGWQNVVAISAGDTHSVALLKNGTVVATGYQYPGECDTNALMSAAGSNRIVAISAGHNHTLALLDNGRVVGIGYAGNSSAYNVSGWTNIATIVTGTKFSAGLRTDGTVVVTESSWNVSGWNDIIALAAGDYFLLGLRANGTAVCVGDTGKPDVSEWRNIVHIAAGHDHAVAIDSNGYIHNAGANSYGQHFGSGTNINDSP